MKKILVNKILPNTTLKSVMFNFMVDGKNMVSQAPVNCFLGNTDRWLILGTKRTYKKKK